MNATAEFSDVKRDVFNATCDRILKDSVLSDPDNGLTISYIGTQLFGKVSIQGDNKCLEKDFRKALNIFIEEYNR